MGVKRLLVSSVCLILLTASTATAQTVGGQSDLVGLRDAIDSLTPAPSSPTIRRIADVGSYITWGAAIALDAKAAWDAPQRTRALVLFGTRQAATNLAVWGLKKAVHRVRPCAKGLSSAAGYDTACSPDNPDTSFPSGHTAGAFASIDWHGQRKSLSLSLAVGTGAGRIVADKHFLSDVLGGAGIGLLGGLIR